MQTHLSVALGNAGDWLNGHIRHLASHDIHPVTHDGGRAVFETEFGRVKLVADNSNLDVSIDSSDEDGLAVLQGAISEQLIASHPSLAKSIDWQGAAPRTGSPKNFRAMTIRKIAPVSDWLLRMTLTGDALEPFAERGLHVRLMFRPNRSDRPVIWPTVSKSGAIQYPDGEDELVVRVYTIREIEVARGEVVIDIVRHAGGAFADWSETAEPGTLIGMIGPGGGFFPPDGWLSIGGDDTAVPAILRILEERKAGLGGKAIIGLKPGQTPLDVTPPDGFSIDWVPFEALPDAMRAVTAPEGVELVAWFAGEAEQAREIRDYFKTELALPAERRSSAVYWRRNPDAHDH